jgi:hypothetical protein
MKAPNMEVLLKIAEDNNLQHFYVRCAHQYFGLLTGGITATLIGCHWLIGNTPPIRPFPWVILLVYVPILLKWVFEVYTPRMEMRKQVEKCGLDAAPPPVIVIFEPPFPDADRRSRWQVLGVESGAL